MKIPKDLRVVGVITLTWLALVFIRISRVSNNCASKLLDWRDYLKEGKP